MALRFDDRVVLITGAGNGIGREYALEFARRGAKVVVNDLGVDNKGQGNSSRAADKVVEEIRALGGQAVANYDSVEQGDRIVQTALEAFGRIDVLINNAGILRDSSFLKMTEAHWDPIVAVNLKGPFLLSKAAWPHMRKQKYGRIIFTSSGSGLYGNFGQSNYAAAKMGLNGLSSTLAKEGSKYNINVNTIAPMAITRLTDDVMSSDVKQQFPASKIVPAVIWISHESNTDTGQIFEVGGGVYTRVRLQRSKGVLLQDDVVSAEDLQANWGHVQDFSEVDYPEQNDDIILKRFQMANKTSAQLDSTTLFRALKGFVESGGLAAPFIYHFEILKDNGEIDTFTLDLKSNQVQRGLVGKADATYNVAEADFVAIATKQLAATTAIVQKKLRIRGNKHAASKLMPKLFPAVTPELLTEFAGAKL
mmetsp:Transcript_26388/g.47382  ORF Transcript_26388/g.47382 Transcript_26388/m.47382 type:complete len:421 (+) Transcript_26388:959-2221(+)